MKRLCEWVKAPELEQIVSTALMQSEEEASVAILESSGVTIESWQADRERLNLEKWEFSDTARTWQSTLKQFVGVLKVIAARSSRVNLADAQSLIEVINAITGPSQYKFLPAKAVDNNKAVVLAAQEFLEREDGHSNTPSNPGTTGVNRKGWRRL